MALTKINRVVYIALFEGRGLVKLGVKEQCKTKRKMMQRFDNVSCEYHNPKISLAENGFMDHS